MQIYSIKTVIQFAKKSARYWLSAVAIACLTQQGAIAQTATQRPPLDSPAGIFTEEFCRVRREESATDADSAARAMRATSYFLLGKYGTQGALRVMQDMNDDDTRTLLEVARQACPDPAARS
jgi:hypothetical protein